MQDYCKALYVGLTLKTVWKLHWCKMQQHMWFPEVGGLIPLDYCSNTLKNGSPFISGACVDQ